MTMIPQFGRRSAMAAAALLCAIEPAAAVAQPARAVDELKTRARAGDVIYVMDAEGRETKGTLLMLTDTTLTLGLLGDRYEVSFARVARVEREGDSAWSGFAIGAGIGAFLGLLAGQGCSGEFTARPVLEAGLVYGGIGALIDAAHTGRTRLYNAPLESPKKTVAIAPIVMPARKGLALTVRWK